MEGDLNWLDLPDLEVAAETTLDIHANWKLLVEGGLEAYHFKVAHRDTIAPYFNDNQSTYELLGDHIRSVLLRTSFAKLAATAKPKVASLIAGAARSCGVDTVDAFFAEATIAEGRSARHPQTFYFGYIFSWLSAISTSTGSSTSTSASINNPSRASLRVTAAVPPFASDPNSTMSANGFLMCS